MKEIDTRQLAKRIRIHTLKMANTGGSSHIGSCLSIADIMAVLYSKVLRVSPENPKDPERDRFILSKGHAGAAIYATLAEMGFCNPEILKTHYQDGSTLCGHVSHKAMPGIELSTGSLGHGLSLGAGMAKAAQMDEKTHRVFVLLSDGECDEGSTWEAILFAAHHRLDNLIAIVDYNNLQGIGRISEVLALEPFAEKWASFGWGTKVIDGHDHTQLEQALTSIPYRSGRPSVIIARTVKGKGVSFMEDTVLWHYRCPRGKEFDDALKELEEQL